MCTLGRLFASMLAAVAMALLSVGVATAGEYHVGATLNCSDCHVTHDTLTSDPEGLSLSGSQSPLMPLTRGASVTATCLQCHDNKPGTSDVVGPDINNPFERYDGMERAAGQFPATVADNNTGHDLPGGSGDSIVDCTVCHDPHGNKNYRNLRALDGSEIGPIAYVNPMATGLARYRRSNVGYVKNIGDKLCLHCHDYGSPAKMMATTQVGRYVRHPNSSEEKIITIAGVHTNVQHWISGRGTGFEVHGNLVPRVPFAVSAAADFYRAKVVAANDEVFCLSCHKAHGSIHQYGMQWPYGSEDGLAGSSGCNQCHNISGDSGGL